METPNEDSVLFQNYQGQSMHRTITPRTITTREDMDEMNVLPRSSWAPSAQLSHTVFSMNNKIGSIGANFGIQYSEILIFVIFNVCESIFLTHQTTK